MHSILLLDCNETHKVLWWLTMNVNTAFVCLQKNASGHISYAKPACYNHKHESSMCRNDCTWQSWSCPPQWQYCHGWPRPDGYQRLRRRQSGPNPLHLTHTKSIKRQIWFSSKGYYNSEGFYSHIQKHRYRPAPPNSASTAPNGILLPQGVGPGFSSTSLM